MLRLLADENIPSLVIKRLREAGYDIATVPEAAAVGTRNDELANLSANLGRTLLSRDADFTALKQSLMEKLKVIYLRMSGDPAKLAELVLLHIESCSKLLEARNVVILDEDGCH